MTEFFYTFLLTTASALCVAVMGVCYKSRCTKVSFCGVNIERDAALEEKFDELALKNQQQQQQ